MPVITTRELFARKVKVYADRPATVDEMLKNTVEKFPDNEAIVMGDLRQTYRELDQVVERLATKLQQSNIQKGDRVALLLRNKPEFIHIILACARIGAIAVPLNTRLSQDELTFMLAHSGATLLFSEMVFKETVEAIEQSRSTKLSAYYFVDEQKETNSNYKRYLHDVQTGKRQEVKVKEEDPLFIMYTSGTTGTPKGAIGSHINAIHSAMNYKNVFREQNDARTIIAVPLFHVTGLIGQMFYMILLGGTSVLLEKYKNEPFLQLLQEEDITFLFNVPTIYVMMMSHPLFKENEFPHLRTIAYGGAPMPKDTIERLRKELPGITLYNVYGSTETCSPATIMPSEYSDDKLSSVGLPVPVGELKIMDENGEELLAGQVGELWIKGPMVVQGYWNNEEANQSSFENGFWKSGDIASIDDDGFVYIMDRKKDMINRGGEKIFSIEVENMLYDHPAVLEAAVVGIPDEVFGEQVKAYIVLKEDAEASEEDLKMFLRKKLADYKVPKYIDFIDELPRNPGGKILKNRLVEMNA